MNALVTAVERPYAIDLDRIDFSDIRGNYGDVYWQSCPKTQNWVVVSVYNGRAQTATKRAFSYDEAVEKIKTIVRGRNYDIHRFSDQIWSRELFNAVRMKIKNKHPINNKTLESEIMSSYANPGQPRLASALAGKGVHIVWNMTSGCYVDASEDPEKAREVAERLAAENPLNKYLICAPSQVIYQPRNIKIETYVPGEA